MARPSGKNHAAGIMIARVVKQAAESKAPSYPHKAEALARVIEAARCVDRFHKDTSENTRRLGAEYAAECRGILSTLTAPMPSHAYALNALAMGIKCEFDRQHELALTYAQEASAVLGSLDRADMIGAAFEGLTGQRANA